MPKAIPDIEGFKFFFFSNEGNEPPHVHVRKGEGSAKFWLLPEVDLYSYTSFKIKEIKRAWELIELNKNEILKTWYEYFKRE